MSEAREARFLKKIERVPSPRELLTQSSTSLEYDVQILNASGNTYTLVRGSFNILQDVTRS
jgi:hypothetical protein